MIFHVKLLLWWREDKHIKATKISYWSSKVKYFLGKIILKQVLLKNYDIFLWIDFCIDHWNSYQNEIEKEKKKWICSKMFKANIKAKKNHKKRETWHRQFELIDIFNQATKTLQFCFLLHFIRYASTGYIFIFYNLK